MATLTVEELKKHLNITESGEDAELGTTLVAAVAAVETVVGPIAPTTKNFVLRVDPRSAPLLPIYPVISITWAIDAAGSAVDVSRVLIDDAGFAHGLPSGVLTMSCEAGRFPVPSDIVQAIKEMARHLWATQRGHTRRPGSAESSLSNTIPGAAYALPIRVSQLLAPHHVPQVS